MKSLILAFVTGIVFLHPAYGQEPERFSRVRTFVKDKTALERVWQTGIDFEGSSGKMGGWMEFVAGPEELRRLKASAISFETVNEDLSVEYRKHLQQTPANVLGFGYGSMGGYFTNAEVNQQIDSMRLIYPGLISSRQHYGTSYEGRDLWSVVISNNPGVEEPSKPEVLYTALHHAREPEGMMTVLYYMWWLLENYGSNPEATYLVNTRKLWFIPVVNPDGYVYNQTTNPGGGGLWRKNRRNNGSGTFGVDLNRNYGTMTMWNAPNGGSSTSPGSDTYRGTAPFSEPEIAAIDTFMRAHNFKACFNYHTYGNYLIYPWGYLSTENGDSLIYRDWAYEMTYANHYTNGTDLQTVAYSTRGTSDDYMFGDTTKPKTYAMTSEVGTTGFWPATALIFPLAVENLPQNKALAYVAGQYTTLLDYSFADSSDRNGFLDRGEKFSLTLNLKNRGLKTANGLSVSVTTNSADIHIIPASVPISSLNPQQSIAIVCSGSVNDSAVVGIPFNIYVRISDPEGYLKYDTLQTFLGTPTTVFADSASGGTGLWTTGEGWGLSSSAHSPPNAFTDSPGGAYAPNADNSLTTGSSLDLSGYQFAELRFWTKWAVEPTWDFATVELSTNNGSTWATLRSKLSHQGSGRSGSKQPSGTWGYESYTPGMNWIEQRIDLSTYVNTLVKLRFRLSSEGAEQRDGFYVDDIRLYGYHTEAETSPPLPPTLASPPDGAKDQPLSLVLSWHPSATAAHYEVQLAADSGFTTIIIDDSTITDTSHIVGSLSNNAVYYWRVRCRNIAGWSAYSETRSFATPLAIPVPPTLLLPADGALHRPTSIQFVWQSSPGAATYRLQLAFDSLFMNSAADDTGLTQTVGVVSSLIDDTTYYWRVQASNIVGTSGWSTPPFHFSTGTVTIALQTASSWNLLSLPLDVVDPARGSVFPGASSGAFAYIPTFGYELRDSIRKGVGYWLKFSSSPLLEIVGSPFSRDTIPVQDGWNLIGSLSDAIRVSAISSIPGGIQTSRAFRYSSGGYSTTDTLFPGYGYWVKVNQSGRLILDAEPSANRTIRVVASSDQPPAPPDENHQGTFGQPTSYSLFRNYPNPFNPSTEIRYALPEASRVTVRVYNILGGIVGTLVDKNEEAGYKSVRWDASNYPSGVYICRLEAISLTSPNHAFREVQKMMIVR